MNELRQGTSELSVVITDIVEAISDSISIVITQINQELTNYVQVVSFLGTDSIVKLLDDIFDLYSYEWVMANQAIQELDAWVNRAAIHEATKINSILSNFTEITDLLLEQAANQISKIDEQAELEYNKRMFAIYGSIADFSIAINAPPSYLEEAIQNARFFAMSIACFVGLPYYEFLFIWNNSIETLLAHIRNSISFYQANPQQIKIDIETLIVKPIFEVEVHKRRDEIDLIVSLQNRISGLENLQELQQTEIAENRETISNLFVLKIKPLIDKVRQEFTDWRNAVYQPDLTEIRYKSDILRVRLNNTINELHYITDLAKRGGDLLLSIDKLPDIERFEQENKIAEVATRRDKRVIAAWMGEVEKHL